MGGSSGAVYAKQLLDKLSQIDNIEVALVRSKNAEINWSLEIDNHSLSDYPFKVYYSNDFFAPFASGSARFDTMVICPCSMGLLARISQGISDDLITRAADVMLKEGRKLILVPRESPYNLIHIRNMEQLILAGAMICPATPSFYSKPQTIEDVVDTVVFRILDLIGLSNNTGFRWGQKE